MATILPVHPTPAEAAHIAALQERARTRAWVDDTMRFLLSAPPFQPGPFVGSSDWPAEEDEGAWERMLDRESAADEAYHVAAEMG